MGDKLKHFLFGAGSVVDVLPATPRIIERPDFMQKSDAQRIGSDWQRVGLHLRHAMSVQGKRVQRGTRK